MHTSPEVAVKYATSVDCNLVASVARLSIGALWNVINRRGRQTAERYTVELLFGPEYVLESTEF